MNQEIKCQKKFQKLLSQRIRESYYKTLGTSVINSPMSPSFLLLEIIITKTFLTTNPVLPRMYISSGREETLGCLLHRSPKFYNNVSSFVGSMNLGFKVNFDHLDHKVECSNVSKTNWRGNFVFLHWGCALIYRLLSYPFRSLACISSWLV